MRRYKPILLVGAALLFAALAPASALAKAGGTDRPMKGSETGTSALDLSTGAAVSDSTGHVSHLGRVTAHGESTVVGSTLTGTTTITAANGDQLVGDLTGTISPGGQNAVDIDGVVTITGGTGRFADATGSLTFHDHNALTSMVGSTAFSTDDITFTGTVSY